MGTGRQKLWGKSIPGRQKSKCKGPEAESSPPYSRDSKKVCAAAHGLGGREGVRDSGVGAGARV